MLKNRINQKNSEKIRKIRKFPENVANFFEKSLVRCLDFPKISTSLKIIAYKPLLIKKTKCTWKMFLCNFCVMSFHAVTMWESSIKFIFPLMN